MATDLANKPDNDWQDIMFRPALMQNYNLSVKGGGKYSTYYTGLGYFNQDGIVKVPITNGIISNPRMIIKEGYSLLEQISLFHSVMTSPFTRNFEAA